MGEVKVGGSRVGLAVGGEVESNHGKQSRHGCMSRWCLRRGKRWKMLAG